MAEPSKSMGAEPGLVADGAAPADGVPVIAELVRDFHEPLYRYAFRLAGSLADAEDLTQQTFLIALEKLHQLREPDKVLRWLYSILRTCYLKGRARNRVRDASSLELDVDALAAEVEPDEIDSELLQRALDEIPDDYKCVLLMYFFEDCSYKEIAAQLEIPLGTVMSRLSRAKAQLKNRLVKRAEHAKK